MTFKKFKVINVSCDSSSSFAIFLTLPNMSAPVQNLVISLIAMQCQYPRFLKKAVQVLYGKLTITTFWPGKKVTRKIPFTDPGVLFYVRAAYAAVQLFQFAVFYYTSSLVRVFFFFLQMGVRLLIARLVRSRKRTTRRCWNMVGAVLFSCLSACWFGLNKTSRTAQPNGKLSGLTFCSRAAKKSEKSKQTSSPTFTRLGTWWWRKPRHDNVPRLWFGRDDETGASISTDLFFRGF